jgi:hypothetical protein
VDELVKLVQQKTGLGETQAKQAVDTVVRFIKQKLPAPVAAQVEAALRNEALVDQADDLVDKGMDALGGLLSKNRG